LNPLFLYLKVDIIGKMTEKKLLDIKKIALSFLYIPFLQKQELVCKLLDKISIERNIFHIKPDKVHK
jgi:hypothetical protein